MLKQLLTTEYLLCSDLHLSYFNYLKSQDLLVPSGYIQEIDSWVNRTVSTSSSNYPLLLTGANGCGKSTLISKWIEYYLQSYNHNQTMILCHFVGLSCVNTDYSSTLYHLSNTIKVRNT